MTRIYLFPGQGSQTPGMGKDLFSRFPEEVAKADEILGYSIERLCLENPDEKLNLTQYTQPALYVVNALACFDRIRNSGESPSYAAGHSLGEYNALLAAGAFDFSTGLRLVQERGRLMGEAGGGGMAAIVGLEREHIEKTLTGNGLDTIDIANLNAPDQTVVSGPSDRIEQAAPLLEKAGARRVVPLKVSAAFHSRYMKPAADAFEEFLKQFAFSPLSFPVVANATARPYGNDEIGRNLARQIQSPVRWTESMAYLLERSPDAIFEEVGPGRVLTGLLRKIRSK